MSTLLDPNSLLMGWLVGRRIAGQRKKQEKEPIGYLYGTPSESGNIGLRNGNTVTYYDGAVLPKLLDLVHEGETFSFVAMTNDSTGTVPFAVHASQRELFVSDRTMSDGRVATSIRMYHPRLLTRHSGTQGEDWRYYDNSLKEYVWGEWAYHAESYVEDPAAMLTLAVDGNLTGGKIVWANHKILTEDGSIYHPASNPIPVSGIAEYIDDIPIYEICK